MSRNAARPAKPTVFLSHSSTNRRELLALKRLLDERAGGMIEFFLSSDDDSIAHGTIWPAEVRAALDRMSLMLIFVSSEALKSGWTYFEAGYGLHKLKTANIYCLPGTDKATLPSPFDILQNRNLHSARDVGLLLRQVNDTLGGRMDESVPREIFDRIFKRPSLGRVEIGPRFEELVESVTVSLVGPYDSIEIFCRVCSVHQFPVSSVEERRYGRDERYSTGLRISVDRPGMEELLNEFEITRAIRKAGKAKVIEYSNGWAPYSDKSYMRNEATIRTVREIEAQNARVRKENARLEAENAKSMVAPRECEFTLSPINIDVPIAIIDYWIADAKLETPIAADIKLHELLLLERRIEVLTAKIHGSEITLRADGTLLWADSVITTLDASNRKIGLMSVDGKPRKVSDFRIPDLMGTLFELNILSSPEPKGSKRRR
jgi:TIR domain